MKAVVVDHPVFGACINLRTDEGDGALVALHGAHVVSWTTAEGAEHLFVSSLASTRNAIRGGVPICFPQFAGLGELPKHGYARTAEWRHGGGGRFILDVSPHMWDGFPSACALALEVTLGPRTLVIGLTIHNVGSSPLSFTGALHSYLLVDDVRTVRVDGFGAEGQTFGEEVDLSFSRVESPALVTVSGEPSVLCAQTGFRDGVVWNIGAVAAERIADLGKGEWLRYVCVEAAALQSVNISPGERWTGTQTLVALSA